MQRGNRSMTLRPVIFYSAILSSMLAGVLAIWGFGFERRWLRGLVRASGVIVVVSASAALLVALAFHPLRPAPRLVLKSPGGHFVARVEQQKDAASVSVRPAWSPIAEQVYAGSSEPEIRWLDEWTLEIRYPSQPGKTSCHGSWVGVKVVCTEVVELRNDSGFRNCVPRNPFLQAGRSLGAWRP
ncbi:MAG: hypothetical protein ABSE87_09145 [Terracidiphilus sp.]|jgi:hypothetical protein